MAGSWWTGFIDRGAGTLGRTGGVPRGGYESMEGGGP